MLFNALATAAAFGVLVLGVYFVAQTVVMRGFQSVEREQGHENGLRLRFAVRAQVLQIEDIGLSWADWTDAFNYVSAPTRAAQLTFETQELSATSLSSLDCDLMFYFASDGRKIFVRSIDHLKGRTFPCPDSFVEGVRQSGLIDHLEVRPTRSGIINVNGQPLLVALQRVHRSGRPNEWSGAVVVGRWVSAKVKSALHEQLRLPVQLGVPTGAQAAMVASSAPGPRILVDRNQAGKFKADDASPVRVSENGDTLRVETLFFDPRGRTVLWASALMPRTVQEQGQASVNSFLLALLGLGSVSLAVALGLQAALARADGARQRESDYFDLMTDHLPDRLVIRDLQNGVIRAYGEASGDGNSDWLDSCLSPETLARRGTLLSETVASGQGREAEWETDGRVWLELLSPVRLNGDEAPVSHLISTSIDISQRKSAEREKDVLLKEIHHRVKNNLQIVVSLLNLQSDVVQDVEARLQFEDARARVRSMALIHEQLYRQEDLSHVDFGAYLDSLLANLLRSYSNSPVELHRELQSVWLDIDIAVPCGLIVTELISNAFKHAFNARTALTSASVTPRQLRVELCALPDGRVRLAIEDDGPGLPPNFCLEESESLGLQIVDSLATQIDACVEVGSGQNGRGTKWTLEFAPVESSDKRLISAR